MDSRLKQRVPIITATILTGIDYIIALLTSRMVYFGSDEGYIQGVLSGSWTGEPYPIHPFLNVFISFPIAGLYKLFPGVQWWYVCNQILVATGIFLVHYFILKISRKNKFPIFFVIPVLLFFDLGFFIFLITSISFTMVPALFGAGIIAGLFWLGDKEDIKHKKWIFTGIIIGYIIILSWRRSSGLVILCYLLLALLYYFVRHSENWKKTTIKFMCMTGVLLALTAVLTVTNRTIQTNRNGEEYMAFNSARVQFMDYPHVEYDEDPEIYEEVGWDKDTYIMATEWGFIDEHINADSLAYINEYSEVTREDRLELIKDLYHNNFDMSILMLCAASFVLAGFATIICREKTSIVFWILNNAGTVIFFCYLIMGGRANYRALMVFLLPAVVINLMLSFHKEMRKRIIRNSFMILTAVLGVICAKPMFSPPIFNQIYKSDVTKTTEKYAIMCEYIEEHRDNFYVMHGGTADYIAPIDPSIKTYNLIKWGGTFYYSDQYYEQLKANGLIELTGETFKKDNVYFVSSSNALSESFEDNGTNPFVRFYNYLKKEHGALGFVLEDKITDGAYVYHLVFEENLNDYDSYYDIVDGHTVQIDP